MDIFIRNFVGKYRRLIRKFEQIQSKKNLPLFLTFIRHQNRKGITVMPCCEMPHQNAEKEISCNQYFDWMFRKLITRKLGIIQLFTFRCVISQQGITKSKPDYLLKLLSAIEYTEAILEITVSKIFGEKFKWFIILLTELAKSIIKLQLLIIHKIGIQGTPSLFNLNNFLNKMNVPKKDQSLTIQENTNLDISSNNGYIALKHSGRIVRTIKNSPTNIELRDWSLPTDKNSNKNAQNKVENETQDPDVDFDPTQDKLRYIAEVLHIIRPLCHLGSMFIFSSKSWKQFILALSIDALSLFLMNGTHKMSKRQKEEMRRRTILFLHYFIRSPFYDLYSILLINVTLSQFEQRIPGMKFLIKPIKEYIPYWQSIYHYCWTS